MSILLSLDTLANKGTIILSRQFQLYSTTTARHTNDIFSPSFCIYTLIAYQSVPVKPENIRVRVF